MASEVSDPWLAIAIAEDRRELTDGVLRHQLASPRAELRARAALAVGRLQDSTSVHDLLPLLADTALAVRHEAVFALGQIGHRSAREPLEALLRGPDLETTALAVEALGKIGQKSSTATVASFLAHATPRLRGEAAVALWRIADSTALGALLERIDDPDPEVRWRVLYALEKIHAPESIVLTAALQLQDGDARVRAYAARTIGREKSSRGGAYLIQALDDPDLGVVVNALRSLQLIADTTCNHCGAAILRTLAHPHPYVRVTAAGALVDRFAWTAADSATRHALTDSLARHLHDSDAATRGASARALLAHGGKGAIDARLWLGDSSEVTRVAVLQGPPLLIERLAPTHALLERMTAAGVLGQLHARESLQALRAGLADSSSLFVSACAGALADLGDSASVPQMVGAFAAHAADADADARLSLRDALRGLAGTRLADSLEAAHPARNAFPATYPADFAEPPSETGAVIHTTAGDITWAFARQEAPQTVKNFVRLARRGYFDGDMVHRVVPNFVIQDGDPTGTGSGGPGYTIRCEYNQLRYDPGMVGMALSGKDTGGSQWFITHSPQHHLNGRYTIFARVTAGMDVVQRIVQGDRILKVDILR